jgi:putative MATE family efflux protein
MLRFAVPLILSGILQLLYNAADLVIVGQFTDSNAIGAVGATTSLNHLIINAFIGLSVGTNVVIARAIGAKEPEKAASLTHTAITVSVLIGISLSIVGFFGSQLFLSLMGTPAEILNEAALYLRIISLGFPACMLYNFGAAVLRACGDTKRPLYFLTVSGLINVTLNLLFVIAFKMRADGVALATIISQYISAMCVVLALQNIHGPCRLFPDQLKMKKQDLVAIMKVGIPAGIQSCCFSLSNVLIQSTINSFGAVAVAANTAAGNIEGFVLAAMDGVTGSCLTFVGQNAGAKQYRRIPRIMLCSGMLCAIICVLLGGAVLLFPHQCISVYSTDSAVIDIGVTRLFYTVSLYFLVGCMNTCSNTLRAMGFSFLPMLTCIAGVCGLRILWIYGVFPFFRTLTSVYISYPMSWLVTFVTLLCIFLVKYHRLLKTERSV